MCTPANWTSPSMRDSQQGSEGFGNLQAVAITLRESKSASHNGWSRLLERSQRIPR